MNSSYILKIHTDKQNFNLLNDLFAYTTSSKEAVWEYSLEEDSAGFANALCHFIDLLESKQQQLVQHGFDFDEVSIWYLYEYSGQCNMEFEPQDLKRLGNLGVRLCISCWEGAWETLRSWNNEQTFWTYFLAKNISVTLCVVKCDRFYYLSEWPQFMVDLACVRSPWLCFGNLLGRTRAQKTRHHWIYGSGFSGQWHQVIRWNCWGWGVSRLNISSQLLLQIETSTHAQ